jgi:hypothetical protein
MSDAKRFVDCPTCRAPAGWSCIETYPNDHPARVQVWIDSFDISMSYELRYDPSAQPTGSYVLPRWSKWVPPRKQKWWERLLRRPKPEGEWVDQGPDPVWVTVPLRIPGQARTE